MIDKVFEMTKRVKEISEELSRRRELDQMLMSERKELKDEIASIREYLTEHEVDDPRVTYYYTHVFEADLDKLDVKYHTIDERAIKKELQESHWTKRIDGVNIIKEKRLRLSEKNKEEAN